MRKRLIFILTLTCMMILTMSFGGVSTAFAANDSSDSGKAYKYEIKIYPGSKGTYNGSSSVTTLKKNLGDSVVITLNDVEVTDDKYYPRGFRIAGHDNDEVEFNSVTTGFINPSFKVSEDVNYEVAYGIKGAMVPYTIRYLDNDTGAVIHEEDVYYGMPGDKPVVSYRYIEGYQPNAYNLAKRLTENASDNVFEFRYTKGAAAQTTTTVTVNPAAPGTAANPAGANAPGAVAAANAANNGNTTIGDNATPLADGPSQFTDIDGNETPLADGSSGGIAKILPYLIGGVVALAIILALLWYLLRKRKDDEEEEEEEVFNHVYK